MLKPIGDQVLYLHEVRTKIERELRTTYESIDGAIQKRARRVNLEMLVIRCKDFLVIAIHKNKQ